MILWINGPFGVGKTSVARRLTEVFPGSILFDPEQLGVVAALTLPGKAAGDFQNLAVWREMVPQFALSLERHCSGPIVVPMSLWKFSYFDEIVGRLRVESGDFFQVTLMASEEELRRRINGTDGGQARRLEHDEPCLRAFGDSRFAPLLFTDHLTVEEVADATLQLVRAA